MLFLGGINIFRSILYHFAKGQSSICLIKGGLFSGLKRKVLGGESLFMNTFRCTEGKGEVAFAPGYPG
ncbi:hypothetical protein DRN58_07005, partial [Thermococci archaeon]